MSNVAYVNGEYVPEDRASVSIFDRGFLFADGVYEVSAVLRGRLVDNAGHIARLGRSLKEMGIVSPVGDAEIVAIQRELVKRNAVDEGVVYLQMTRGPAPRDFAYPADPKPTLIMFTQAKRITDSPAAENGIKVISLPEIRWQRRDIKTVGLLAASMGKQAALDAGADDAWFVENGHVTEGTSNNAYIITAAGALVTRNLGTQILAGITRTAVLALSAQEGIAVEERAFTIDEARAAAEAFCTSASSFVTPVTHIDGHPIGDGTPGPMTRRLRDHYIEASLAQD